LEVVLYTSPPEIVRIHHEEAIKSNVVIVPVVGSKDDYRLPEGGERFKSILEAAASTGAFKFKQGEVFQSIIDGVLVFFAGCEKPEAEYLRRCIASAVKQASRRYNEVTILAGGLFEGSEFEAAISAALAAYSLDEFRKERRIKLSKILVTGGFNVDEARAIVEGIYLARDVANAPPNELAPRRLAEHVRRIFSQLEGIEVKVLSYEDLLKGGFGGIVSVGKGSEEKPVLIVISYDGGEGDPVALVGKTVVFDSGGINLKPSQGITLMRSDKAGGAAVLGATWIIARLRLPVKLYALLPVVINVPSGSSYLPSDVIKMWDGTRVEVNNTDAEGRLILADAIAYAAKKLGAKKVIDAATLTGAIVVALGPLVAGLFTRSEDLAKIIEEATEATGEKVWRMPMVDEYKAWLTKAPLGDIVNVGGRYGGAIFAALFLERFTHGAEWAHLDIAGPGIGLEAHGVAPSYWPEQQAPGYGARLLAETIKRLSQEVNGA